MKRKLFLRALPTALILMLVFGSVAYAQEEGGVTSESQIDVIWLLVAAFLVFFMQAGFAMVESGFSRAKNAANLLMKILMDFSAGSLLYFILGFGLMYGASAGGFLGPSNCFLSEIGFGADSAYDVAHLFRYLRFLFHAATVYDSSGPPLRIQV